MVVIDRRWGDECVWEWIYGGLKLKSPSLYLILYLCPLYMFCSVLKVCKCGRTVVIDDVIEMGVYGSG